MHLTSSRGCLRRTSFRRSNHLRCDRFAKFSHIFFVEKNPPLSGLSVSSAFYLNHAGKPSPNFFKKTSGKVGAVSLPHCRHCSSGLAKRRLKLRSSPDYIPEANYSPFSLTFTTFICPYSSV